MGRINWGRVFLGGLLAGVVINVGEFLFHAVLFKDQMAEAMRALGKDPATVMTGGKMDQRRQAKRQEPARRRRRSRESGPGFSAASSGPSAK